MIKIPHPRTILVALSLVAFLPVLRVGFLWDDHVLIEQNPYIRHWSAANLHHDLTSTVSNGYGDEGYFRPVVTWSNRLDYRLWGLNPFGFHLTNVLLHIANTVLLFQLFLSLGFSPLAALLAASLFGVHPIAVEGQLCVTGRATFLSFFFSLLTVLAYLRPVGWRWGAGLLTCALALLSKEIAVTVPLLVLIVWHLRREPTRVFWKLWPLIAMLSVYLIYRHWLFGHAGNGQDPWFTAQFFIEAFPRILGHYVRVLLMPWDLHSHRMILRMSHLWFVALLIWGFVVTAAIRKREAWPWFYFSVGWFLAVLIPPGFAMVNGGFMFDHWGYAAAPAVFLPLGILFEHAWLARADWRQAWIGLAYFPLLIGYALLVALNVELRGTDEKLYRWALHFTTSNPIKYNLGALLLQTGRPLEALPYLEDVMRAYPEDPNASHALARAYWDLGYHHFAKRLLRRDIQRFPGYQPAMDSLRMMERLDPQV